MWLSSLSGHRGGLLQSLGARPKTQPDLWGPCTPSPALPPAVLAHALEGAPCAPRRRHRIWGTWPPNLSARSPAAPLVDEAQQRDVAGPQRAGVDDVPGPVVHLGDHEAAV